MFDTRVFHSAQENLLVPCCLLRFPERFRSAPHVCVAGNEIASSSRYPGKGTAHATTRALVAPPIEPEG